MIKFGFCTGAYVVSALELVLMLLVGWQSGLWQRCCCLDQYSEWALCGRVGGGGSEGVQLNDGEE